MNASVTTPELVAAPKSGALPDIVDVAMKHKGLVLTGLLLGIALGVVTYLKLGPAYETKTRILVSKKGNVQLNEDDTGNRTYGERGEHVTLIMSPLIVKEAVETYELGKLASLRTSSDPVEDIVDAIKARRTAGSDLSFLNVVDLAFESEVRGDGPRILDAIAKTYASYLKRTQGENTDEAVTSVDDRAKKLENELHEAEQKQLELRQKAPFHWKNAPGTSGQSGDTTNLHQERVLRLEQERRDQLVRRAQVESKLATIERLQRENAPAESLEFLVRRYLYQDGNNSPAAAATSDAGSGALFVDPRISLLDQRLTPLMLEEQRLTRDFGYGEDHPQVKLVKKNMEAVRQFFRDQGLLLPDEPGGRVSRKTTDLVAMYVASLKQEKQELDLRDKSLSALVDEETVLAKQYTKFLLEDQRLAAEIQRLTLLWQTVKTSIAQVDLLKDNTGYSMKTVAPPMESLSFKKPLKIIGACAMVGMIISCGIVYLRALRDTRMKTVEAIQELLGWRILGRVPSLRLKGRPLANTTIDPGLCFYHHPGSKESESYRSVRSALFVLTHQNGKRIIQVTSPEMADGKTTLTTNLAAAIAQSGKKVLLIDADMRRARVHQMLGLRGEIGLAEVLSGEIALENAVQPTVMEHLTVLTAGKAPANPAELLSSPRFVQLLGAVRPHFDYVLVDTPPLLAVSDPCVVAPYVDGVLLVVRVGKNRAESVEQARELLLTHHAQPLGVVVNGVSEQRSYGQYGYGEYGSGYGYGTSTDSDQAVSAIPVETQTVTEGQPTPHPAMTTVEWIGEGPVNPPRAVGART